MKHSVLFLFGSRSDRYT